MRAQSRRIVRPLGYSLASLAICIGLAVAPIEGVAYADPIGAINSESTSERPSTTTSRADDGRPGRAETDETDEAGGPARRAPHRLRDRAESRDRAGYELDVGVADLEEPNPPGPDDAVAPDPAVTDGKAVVLAEVVEPAVADRSVRRPSVRLDRTTTRPQRSVLPAGLPAAEAPARGALATISVEPTAVALAPQPLSPLAELLTLPARVVNAVLQVLDFTSTADRPDRPYGLAPINDLIFAAFREVERLLGLHRPPPPQPEVPALTYTGPTTRPTPTVAQFLNASASGYVLGSTPGELMPFTVNGFQLSAVNVFSGMVAKTWVTPEGQVIIAYQGTTGGSHLLFNPLITISQVLADLQVVFTPTTPLTFYHALAFADRVQAAAALQGYATDDIFVTGHSLGGWQAQFVAQQRGLAGIGFEAPGMNTRTPGNGADAMFVNIGTYGSSAPYMATDLPGLQPFMPRYVPGGGSKPHFGPIVMIGDPAAMTPLYNASALWGRSLIGSVIFLFDYLMNFFQYHLPRVQAYHLDVTPDPGIVGFLGTARGPVHTGYGTLTIPQLMKAASDDGILFRP
ncbi:hypothetical protein CRI77_12310 [Mycolicibacterium duvalii]|uniref:hypothetical protein n=1 Tax=Mycolicibacterium duvalii TaxID=39688 RepID=UPI000BEEB05C|nr:hypothetical protein [Mycolicibacterium duvalii]MCV7366238.1 hypothetical protein [Mycolicibacterium duvalii]PEG41105.1 hypothetical protein CRI77_12310 [Mycolicibacterium duvalii]